MAVRSSQFEAYLQYLVLEFSYQTWCHDLLFRNIPDIVNRNELQRVPSILSYPGLGQCRPLLMHEWYSAPVTMTKSTSIGKANPSKIKQCSKTPWTLDSNPHHLIMVRSVIISK